LEAKKLSPIKSYINDLNMFVTGRNFWQVSLLKQLEGLDYKQALYKPAEDRHCVWELVRHISYWKHWAITYVKDGIALNAKEDNWAPLPDVQSEEAWQDDINKLKSLNNECKKIAKGIGNELFESTEEKIVFFCQLLYHDCYHTGQIGLLRVMQGLKPLAT